jgi:hypothetical protein
MIFGKINKIENEIEYFNTEEGEVKGKRKDIAYI